METENSASQSQGYDVPIEEALRVRTEADMWFASPHSPKPRNQRSKSPLSKILPVQPKIERESLNEENSPNNQTHEEDIQSAILVANLNESCRVSYEERVHLQKKLDSEIVKRISVTQRLEETLKSAMALQAENSRLTNELEKMQNSVGHKDTVVIEQEAYIKEQNEKNKSLEERLKSQEQLHSQEKKHIQEEISELEERNKGLEELLNNGQSEIEKTQKMGQDLHAELTKKNSVIEQLKAKVKQSQDEVEKLSELLLNEEKERSDLEKTVRTHLAVDDELVATKTQLDDQIVARVSLEEKLKATEAFYTEEIAYLKSQNEIKDEKRFALEDQLRRTELRHQSAITNVEELLGAERLKLADTQNTLETTKLELKRIMNTRDSAVSTADARARQSEAERETMRVKASAAAEQTEHLNKEIASLRSRLEKEKEFHANVLERVQHKLENEIALCSQKDALIDSLQGRLEEVETQLAETQQTLTELQNNPENGPALAHSRLQAEADAAKAEARFMVEQLTAETEALRLRADSQRRAADILEKHLEQAQDTLMVQQAQYDERIADLETELATAHAAEDELAEKALMLEMKIEAYEQLLQEYDGGDSGDELANTGHSQASALHSAPSQEKSSDALTVSTLAPPPQERAGDVSDQDEVYEPISDLSEDEAVTPTVPEPVAKKKTDSQPQERAVKEEGAVEGELELEEEEEEEEEENAACMEIRDKMDSISPLSRVATVLAPGIMGAALLCPPEMTSTMAEDMQDGSIVLEAREAITNAHLTALQAPEPQVGEETAAPAEHSPTPSTPLATKQRSQTQLSRSQKPNLAASPSQSRLKPQTIDLMMQSRRMTNFEREEMIRLLKTDIKESKQQEKRKRVEQKKIQKEEKKLRKQGGPALFE